MKRLITLLFLVVFVSLFQIVLSRLDGTHASSDGTDPPSNTFPDQRTESESEWVYGKIEFVHDILRPDCYFVLLRGHPGSPVPLVQGGYATTDVSVTLKLRGVTAPRALQTKETRNRPHLWLQRERQRWDRAMHYVWSVCGPTRTFRVHNLKVIEEDKVLEGDVEFLLGGQWHLLAVAMLQDKLILPADGKTEWDFGDIEFGPVNPNIPK